MDGNNLGKETFLRRLDNAMKMPTTDPGFYPDDRHELRDDGAPN